MKPDTERGRTKPFRYFIVFLIVTILLTVISYVYIYEIRGKSGNPIRSDGWGYYSYLPAVFDYHDLTFSFSDDPSADCVWIDQEGHYINKYPVGTAVMQMPFFLVVDVFLKIFKPELATGYTEPYQVSVLASTLCYFVIGLVFLYKILKRYFSDKTVLWVLLLITFATNLFHYATFDACFSHIYSFCLITVFVWLTIKIEESRETLGFNLLLGFVLGMIFIVRNPNVLMIVFYLLYGINKWKDIPKRLKSVICWKRLPWNVIGFALPVALQCGYWYAATGHLFIRSYNANETFNWLLPHVVEVLFSVSKGLLFYSPVLIISFIGLPLLKKNGLPYVSIIAVIIIHLYITSSWNAWSYGGSFGQRPFVDIYVIYAVSMGAVIQQFECTKLLQTTDEKESRVAVLSFVLPVFIIFILINVKFMLSYWHGVLPFDGATMTDVQNVFNWNFEEMRVYIDGIIHRIL